MTTVERIKAICKERKIPLSKLERECGFANAYISQLKKGYLPDDRLRTISEYLEVSIDFLQYGKEKEGTISIDSSLEEIIAGYKKATPEKQALLIRLAKDVLQEE